MFKRIKAKLKSRAGLTLTEMLVTVLVLMFFSTACLLGITTALKARQAAIKASDADILSSTIMQYISNEMRLSIGAVPDGGGKILKYDGGSTYAGLTAGSSKIWFENGRLKRRIGEDADPELDKKHEFFVFNDSAYSGLKVEDLSFVKTTKEVDGKDVVTLECSYEVRDAEDSTLKKIQFTVTPLNQPTSP